VVAGRAGTLSCRFTWRALHFGHVTEGISESRRTSVSKVCSQSSHVNSYRGIDFVPLALAALAIDLAGTLEDIALAFAQAILPVLLHFFKDLIELGLEVLVDFGTG
jgi:hypothetical protein